MFAEHLESADSLSADYLKSRLQFRASTWAGTLEDFEKLGNEICYAIQNVRTDNDQTLVFRTCKEVWTLVNLPLDSFAQLLVVFVTARDKLCLDFQIRCFSEALNGLYSFMITERINLDNLESNRSVKMMEQGLMQSLSLCESCIPLGEYDFDGNRRPPPPLSPSDLTSKVRAIIENNVYPDIPEHKGPYSAVDMSSFMTQLHHKIRQFHEAEANVMNNLGGTKLPDKVLSSCEMDETPATPLTQIFDASASSGDEPDQTSSGNVMGSIGEVQLEERSHREARAESMSNQVLGQEEELTGEMGWSMVAGGKDKIPSLGSIDGGGNENSMDDSKTNIPVLDSVKVSSEVISRAPTVAAEVLNQEGQEQVVTFDTDSHSGFPVEPSSRKQESSPVPVVAEDSSMGQSPLPGIDKTLRSDADQATSSTKAGRSEQIGESANFQESGEAKSSRCVVN